MSVLTSSTVKIRVWQGYQIVALLFDFKILQQAPDQVVKSKINCFVYLSELTIILIVCLIIFWTSHKQPLKMWRFSGCLQEVVTHADQTAGDLFRK